MYYTSVILLAVVTIAKLESVKKVKVEGLEKNRMIGVDTVHDEKVATEKVTSIIDKDTIITRNLKLEKRVRGKSGHHHKKQEDAKEPDWSYSAFPQEVQLYVEQFKRNMSECLKEVQANDKRTTKRLSPGKESPGKESPVHGECLIACVLKRNGVIEGGKVNKGNLITLVSKFYAKDTKLMKKLEKNLDRCIDVSSRVRGGECAVAAQLNECTNGLMATNKHKLVVNY